MCVITLLLLAVMLSQNRYCREDNNYKLIALTSAVVILAAFAPSGVGALIDFAMVVSIVFVHIEMDFNIEDLLLCKLAEMLFGKSLSPELNAPFGKFGGGFSELCLRVELQRPTAKRLQSIHTGCRISVVLLGLTTLTLSFTQTVTFFGWWSMLLIPVATLVVMIGVCTLYLKLYQSDDIAG